MNGSDCGERLNLSRLIERLVASGCVAAGAAHVTVIGEVNVAGAEPSSSKTHERRGVGARLLPLTVRSVPPDRGARAGVTSETEGRSETSYVSRVGAFIGTSATPLRMEAPPSMAAATRTAPMGNASAGGAAQRMAVVVRKDAATHSSPRRQRS